MRGLWPALVADVAAVTVLAYGLYFRRHFRADLMLAYVALNVGILAVTVVLAGSAAGLGLGLGLFGVLSIIRLRSDMITQQEIAYYFVSLAMGLIAGLHPDPAWLAPALSATLVAVMFVADHPRLSARAARQTITLDHAYPDPVQLRVALEQLLGTDIRYARVSELDLVRDITVVDVRYSPGGVRTAGVRAGRPLVRRLPGRAL
jgi:Domain of unknown function (DUF4956)